MKEKYKLESWKKTNWKGTERQKIILVDRLVKRDSKGHFISVLKEVRIKSYGSGVYKVGVSQKGKITARIKIADKTPEWYETKKEKIIEHKKRTIFRTSYVLNDIPFRGNVYYGFRIVAFSHNKELLSNIRKQLKDRLIKFIEYCLHYKEDEFWFNLYWGYEAPNPNNAYQSDDGKYYLSWQKRYGAVIKEEQHNLRDL